MNKKKPAGKSRRASPKEASATVLRTNAVQSAVVAEDAFVRMEPGAVIANRLEIHAMLGEGGMGCVYAAHDRLKNEDVAIKVLRPDLQFSSAAKERFLAEAKVSCSLSHPNIVRVHDVGISGEVYYLSMERLKGQTLRQHIDRYREEKRTFRVAEVTNIAHQLIDALDYAHRYIMHRDIKPENIWLAEDGTVKLMDFGIARASNNSQMTKTGTMLGTAYYMSPEQHLDSKKVDWRTDQYSLGVVLYELLAGTLPTGAVQHIDTIRRDLPKRYANALMRAMAPSPKKRFASYDEMRTEMQLPVSRPFRRFARLVLISAVLATVGHAIWKDPEREMKLSAVIGAFKVVLMGTSASASAEATPATDKRAERSISVDVPPPEPTPVSESEAKLESQPISEFAPGSEAQPRSEPEPLTAIETEASLPAPVQSTDAIGATATRD